MDDGVWSLCDGVGPEKVVYLHEPAADLRAIVVIDNTALGVAIGGVRMAPDATLVECARLARAMTLKNALAALPHGGGKAVIVADPHDAEAAKARRVRAFARAIEDLVDYVPGPDMGTDERAMAQVRDEIGRAVGLPAVLGGVPIDQLGATGVGLATAVRVAAERHALALDGARVAVQGFGAVGRHVARALAADGVRLVAASDSRGCIHGEAGLDVEALIAHKRESGALAGFPGAREAAPDAIVDVDCEIWIPAARPDVVDAANVGRLRARLVAEGANIPLAPDAERALEARGTVVLPDIVVNAGGVIAAAVEYRGGDRDAAFTAVATKVGENTRALLDAMDARGHGAREAAEALARERLDEAMRYRRWSGA